MTGLDGFSLRPLEPTDIPALKAFKCADAGRWAAEVEHAINTYVVDELVNGPYGLSVWRDDDLCAVATWRETPDHWHSSVIAVALEYRRQGLARALKMEVVAMARRAGATTVMSTVAWDNHPMIELNRKLGAQIVRAGTGWRPPEYVNAVIRVR